MQEIGGYFELELRKGEEYHKGAIRLNTGRNALELILKVKQYRKVFIPYYTCEVILEPITKLEIDYEYYSINQDFEPIFDYSILSKENGFLYTNYFGLKDTFIVELAMKCQNLIIDNSQAFFAKPIENIPTFYSCRKFFGVPDGAYLYLNNVNVDYPQDNSEERFTHLLKRIEHGPESGYGNYKMNENILKGQSIKEMSKLTRSLLCNIDYEFVKKKRIENYYILQEQFSKINKLSPILNNESVPMIYPLLIDKYYFRQKLIDNKIFVPTYWSNVMEWTEKDSFEYKISSEIMCLPIDQRYTIAEMMKIVEFVNSLG